MRSFYEKQIAVISKQTDKLEKTSQKWADFRELDFLFVQNDWRRIILHSTNYHLISLYFRLMMFYSFVKAPRRDNSFIDLKSSNKRKWFTFGIILCLFDLPNLFSCFVMSENLNNNGTEHEFSLRGMISARIWVV